MSMPNGISADAYVGHELCDAYQDVAAESYLGIMGTQHDEIMVEREKQLRQTQHVLEEVVAALTTAAEELLDDFTMGHQVRVAHFAVEIARDLALTAPQIHGLRVAALAHDIGKIRVPKHIWMKPAPLAPAELALVRTHSQAGYDMLKHIDFPWPVAQIVLQHHEHVDGSGYPLQLKAAAILPEAKILAVADTVEALLSKRPYRSAFPVAEALGVIENGCDTRYDKDVVAACLKLFHTATLTC